MVASLPLSGERKQSLINNILTYSQLPESLQSYFSANDTISRDPFFALVEDFSIYGDNNKATGDIILDYKNVKIGLFDNDEHIVEKLPTFLINNFLIKTDNIPNTKEYRTGKMHYKRPQNRSMFHSWWFTLKNGFQSVILPNVINPKELDH